VVEDYRKDYPVSVLCETLGVSLSGDSAWKKRPMSNHQREDNQLAEHMQEVYHSCRQVYGSPRIHAELRVEAHRELPQAGGASDERAGTVCVPKASSDDHDEK
jgi:putative transposase